MEGSTGKARLCSESECGPPFPRARTPGGRKEALILGEVGVQGVTGDPRTSCMLMGQ